MKIVYRDIKTIVDGDVCIQIVAIAVDDSGMDDVIGFCRISEYDKPVPQITDLYVNPKRRRRGIAENLLGEVFKICGQRTVSLTVYEKNHAAMSLYNKLGFKCSFYFSDSKEFAMSYFPME